MEIIFEKIRAGISTVSIEYSKIAAFGPVPFMLRFGDVHNYRNSILIKLFDETMKCIDCIALNIPIRLKHKTGRFNFIED